MDLDGDCEASLLRGRIHPASNGRCSSGATRDDDAMEASRLWLLPNIVWFGASWWVSGQPSKWKLTMLPGRLISSGAVSPFSLKRTPMAISSSCIVPTSRYTIHADQPAAPTRIARLRPKSHVYWGSVSPFYHASPFIDLQQILRE